MTTSHPLESSRCVRPGLWRVTLHFSEPIHGFGRTVIEARRRAWLYAKEVRRA